MPSWRCCRSSNGCSRWGSERSVHRDQRQDILGTRFRNYRLYFASQAVSFSGTWMQLIALSWLVLQLTGSGTALGTVMAMQFLPTLLLAPFGGMIADRYDKRG